MSKHHKVDLSYLSDCLPEFVLRPEIEKYLKPHFGGAFSKRTMEHHDFVGEGPARCKVGRSIAYRKKDLIEWLENKIISLN